VRRNQALSPLVAAAWSGWADWAGYIEVGRAADNAPPREERGGEPVKGKSYCLVDPICGTRSFASNLPIALVEDGIVTVAAVALGSSGEIVYAEKGKGTRMRTPTGEIPVRASANSKYDLDRRR